MTPDGSGQAPSSARDVLAYFVRNPQAADSLEGVARWRVQQEAIHHTVQQVGQALGWLVEQGYLVREGHSGVAPTFRLNPSRIAEAERFLADLAAHPPAADAVPSHAPVAPIDRPEAPHVPPEAPHAPSALMQQSLAWVDAALLDYHRRNPPDGGDLPGLTRSHSSIEAALTPRVVPSTAEGDATADAADRVDRLTRDLIEAFERAGDREPLAALHRNLGLTPLETQAVLLCLAPEVDAKYQTVYGVLNDDLSRRTMTLGLLCAVLGEPLDVRNALAQSGRLTRWRLLEHGATFPYADEPLRLDSAIVAWLLGDEDALLGDPRLSQVLRDQEWPGARWIRRAADLDLAARLTEALSSDPLRRDWIALSGEDADGSRAVVEAAARAADAPLIRISLASLAAIDPLAVHEAAARLTRAVHLAGAVAALDATGTAPDGVDLTVAASHLMSALTAAARPAVLIVRELQRLVAALPAERSQLLHRDPPDDAAVAAAYAAAAGEAGLHLEPAEAERLATAYPLPFGAIDGAVRLASLRGAPLEPPSEHGRALAAACRTIAAPDLPRFARRVEPVFRLENVVLPADRHAQLNEMVAHVRHASQVLNAWGFGAQLPYGRGVAALFCGPSGTGKTMAAQAIAQALQTDTYVVDLSRVVSKYIGESEKNLDAVCTDAERAGAVLLFDEADALFGKRSEIKDAHDRYANIEVAFLLQRMEAFRGLAILTTNFRRNVDDAFLRRLRFVVEFPKPDAQAREAIWRQCLPDAAPVAPDVNLRFLAKRLELTGGNIRQVTIRAAFAAAGEGSPRIAMRHVVAAARAELLKIGMTATERELAEFEAAGGAAARVA